MSFWGGFTKEQGKFRSSRCLHPVRQLPHLLKLVRIVFRDPNHPKVTTTDRVSMVASLVSV